MAITVDPDWWKTLFDEVYLMTDARTVCDEERTCQEIDMFFRLLELQTDHRVLDLCGGQGRHAIEFCRRGFTECTVLDYSTALLKIGAKEAGRAGYPVRFVQADARNTGLADEFYDRVMVLGNSLGYIPDDEADIQIVKECFRILKSGGLLLLDVSDGKVVRENIAANAWHEIGDDICVCREREISGDRLQVREVVLSRRSGLVRDRTYGIRLYEFPNITALAEKAGFVNVRRHDGEGSKSKEDLGCMTNRMVITAEKA